MTTTSKYTYEGLSLLSLEATAGSTPYTVNYLYDASGRAYAGTYKTATATTVFRLVTTDRGDVVELLDVNGESFASYRYDEWGLPTATVTAGTTQVSSSLAAEISTRQVLRYAGYCYDQHSGMYYLSARTYDPTTRQFLSKDPAKADGEESAYQYCGGDPVGSVDPSGLYYYVVKTASAWWYETQWGSWWTKSSWSKTYNDPWMSGLANLNWAVAKRVKYRRQGREYKYLISRESYRYSATGRTFKVVSYVVSAYYRTVTQDKHVWYGAKYPKGVPVGSPSFKYWRTVNQRVKRGGWKYFGVDLARGSNFKVGTKYL